MYPFKYAVSSRIKHPQIDSAVITNTLQLVSHPTALCIQSFWRHRYDTPNDSNCAAFIQSAASALKKHAAFLRQIRDAGGRVEFFIGWSGEKNFGDTFSHSTLSLLADLQVDLSFDVYDNTKNV